MSFNEIPILDLSLADDPATKPAFLKELRSALLEVGFLYIKNYGIDEKLSEEVIKNGRAFFELPEEAKLEVQMKNAKSFLGYNVLGNETTAHRTDWREQIDLSTEHPVPAPTEPLYRNLLAPNQWPSAAQLPAFRPTYTAYIAAMSKLSVRFTSLIAESLGLDAAAFDRFFDADQQHKLKIIRYPDLDELGVPPPAAGSQAERDERDGNVQGVGPHKDSMLTSYLLQASQHRGLQAQNLSGAWIDCPPIDGTLVVAIGQGLQALTRGVCAATTHRVLSPRRGQGARYSIPFFQGVSYDADFSAVDVPDAVVREKEVFEDGLRAQGLVPEGERTGKDKVEFTFIKGGRWKHLGEATLYNRAKSHGDVARAWYPELWKMICEDREREGVTAEETPADKGDKAAAGNQAVQTAVEAH